MVAVAVLLVCWPVWRAWIVPAARRAHLMSPRAHRRLPVRAGPGLLRRLGETGADMLCRQAGRPYGLTGARLITLQAAGAMAGLLIGTALGSAPIVVCAGVIGCLFPRAVVSGQASRRQAAIQLELPAFLDLWSLMLSAGAGVEEALAIISERHPEWVVSAEVKLALTRVAASGLLGEALVEVARDSGSKDMLGAMEQVRHALEGGGGIAQELVGIARRTREEQAVRLTESAALGGILGVFPKLGTALLSLAPMVVSILLMVVEGIRGG